MNRSPAAAAAPELFAGLSFLFALAAPHAWRNFDLVYSSTAIFFLEFITVHAGAFAATILDAPDAKRASSRAVGLGMFYAVFAIVFGAVFGSGYAGVVVAVTLFWRFLAVVGTTASAREFRMRAFFVAGLYLVLAMLIIAGGLAPRLGVDDAVVAEVRSREAARRVHSDFDPAATTAFLVVWYLVLAVFEYQRVARRGAEEEGGPLAKAGVRLEAGPGWVALQRSAPNWQKGLFLVFAALGLFAGIAGLAKMDFAREAWLVLPVGFALLAGILCLSSGLSMKSHLHTTLTVRRDKVELEAAASPPQAAQALGPVAEFDVVPASRASGGHGYDLLLRTGGEAPVRFSCGAPRPVIAALARLLITLYRFGDRPEALRVALEAEPEMRQLLSETAMRRLTAPR